MVSLHLIPAPMSELSRGRFSFYPAIIGVQHNEWTLRRASWTEILVVNTKTSEELWIPRRFVGDISPIQAPVRIVGLVKELEYKGGAVLPHRRSVIQMPRAVNDFSRPVARPGSGRPAQVLAIRVEPTAESRMVRFLKGSAALGILACLGVVFVVRDAHLGARLGWTSSTPRLPDLAAQDDYASVVRKLGPPSTDRWVRQNNGEGFRRLFYSRKGWMIVLAGRDPETAHYAGTLREDGRVIHAATPGLFNELSQAGMR
jgi:hypothetical protein